MTRETNSTDISAMPDVARLARAVARTGEQYVLSENGVALAIISPVPSQRWDGQTAQPFGCHENPGSDTAGSSTHKLPHEASKTREQKRGTEGHAPSSKASKKEPRRNAGVLTPNDSFWNIVGIARSEGAGDVSEHKHKYLADAYTPKDR